MPPRGVAAGAAIAWGASHVDNAVNRRFDGPIAERGVEPMPLTVVLVHGAWANGSCWNKVVPPLKARGVDVVAVHNPLTAFEADVTGTRRVVDDQPGDVVLVGHSYGGVVITEVGADAKVRALVYVAAFAPSEGESINTGLAPYGQPPFLGELHADAGGMLSWSAGGLAQYFAPDLTAEEQMLLAVTQGPFAAASFDAKVTSAGYVGKPCWFVVADHDQVVPPPLQVSGAEKTRATTIHADSSHVAMLAQPKLVADAILAAVDAVK
jgi:pimeloyl-ACP methyl ester carboxylesterase